MRTLAGLNKAFGYALSMLLLAVASLLIIPAMIRADGEVAWGAIALGQAVGGLGAVLLAYGWQLSGPASVAKADATTRRREYSESLLVKAGLVLPICLVACGVSALLTPAEPWLAVAGTIQAITAGLSANWFFIGLSQPYLLLLLETVPRVAGTVAGIWVMSAGAGALAGVWLQTAGMVVAFVVCTAWIYRTLGAAGATRARSAGLTEVLRRKGHGVVSTMGSATYISAPIMLVSLVAPASQPLYALADKLQRQVGVALQPAATVLQGWVPRGRDVSARARKALLLAAGLGAGSGAAMLLVAPWLMAWLGDGALNPPPAVIVATSVFVGLSVLESGMSKAVLAPLDRLGAVAKATLASAVVGLPLVALGAYLYGAVGALVGVSIGLLVRVLLELRAALKVLREPPVAGAMVGTEGSEGAIVVEG